MTAQKILWLKDVDKEDIGECGRLAVHLGELMRLKRKVPNGFVITQDGFEKFINKNHLRETVHELLHSLSTKNPASVIAAVRRIKALIIDSPIPENLEQEIINNYLKLSRGWLKQSFVAVRPERVFKEEAHTLPSLFHSVLNVHGESNVLLKIKEQWAELFDDLNWEEYFKNNHEFNWRVAIVIQQMVEAEVSGIMTTVNPVSGQKNCAVIEAVYGLGDILTDRSETPDFYEVNKYSMSFVHLKVSKQERQKIMQNGETKLVDVETGRQSEQKLPDVQIMELIKIGKQLEQFYLAPQEVEWAWDEGKFYILGSKPVNQAVIKKLETLVATKLMIERSQKLKVLGIGTAASKGIKSGYLKVIKSIGSMNRVRKGDIIALDFGKKDYLDLLKLARAVAVNEGSMTSEIAMMCRELGIPAVVGIENNLEKFYDGMLVTVDGTKGIVYAGAPEIKKVVIKEQETTDIAMKKVDLTKKIATKIDVLINQVDEIEKCAGMAVDGAILRTEICFNKLKYHPDYYFDRLMEQELLDSWRQDLTNMGQVFSPRPVMIRLWDLDSHDARKLPWGRQFEEEEVNPLLGRRGAFRYLMNYKLAELQFKGIDVVRKKQGLTNIQVMIPFVRSIDEIQELKKMMSVQGLVRSTSMQLWVELAIPSNYVLMERMLKTGIDGVIVNIDILSQMILGVDLKNAELLKTGLKSRTAIMWMVSKIIKRAHLLGLSVGIVSDRFLGELDIIDDLIEAGVGRITVTSNLVDKLRESIYLLEKQVIRGRGQ